MILGTPAYIRFSEKTTYKSRKFRDFMIQNNYNDFTVNNYMGKFYYISFFNNKEQHVTDMEESISNRCIERIYGENFYLLDTDKKSIYILVTREDRNQGLLEKYLVNSFNVNDKMFLSKNMFVTSVNSKNTQLYLSKRLRQFMIKNNYNDIKIYNFQNKFHYVLFYNRLNSDIKDFDKSVTRPNANELAKQSYYLLETSEKDSFILVPKEETKINRIGKYINNTQII